MKLETKLQMIESLAKAATLGPWEVRYREINNKERAKVWAETYGWLITDGDLPKSHHQPSMEFIAELNPETALFLVNTPREAMGVIEFYGDPDPVVGYPQDYSNRMYESHEFEVCGLRARAFLAKHGDLTNG
jgi:hypothetical protein